MKKIELPSHEVEEERLSDRLSFYFENRFLEKEKINVKEILIQNEGYGSFWEQRQSDFLNSQKAWLFLKTCYPQLNFPIVNNIRLDTFYRRAVMKGDLDHISITKDGLGLHGEAVSVDIYKDFFGKVPVVKVKGDKNFEKIIQSLLYQNEPVKIPKSMGASFINGINNWQKIKTLKRDFLKSNPIHEWASYFKNSILPFHYLYKDRIIILSDRFYSNVKPKEIAMDPQRWRDVSLQIRLMHECAHLYTKQRYGVASNNLHDELIADYIGILTASRVYNKNWMLLFMGLENYPKYRRGGRLQNYVQDLKIDSADFNVLKEYIYRCINNIALFEQGLNESLSSEAIRNRIETLCEVGIKEMASPFGKDKLYSKYISITRGSNLS